MKKISRKLRRIIAAVFTVGYLVVPHTEIFAANPSSKIVHIVPSLASDISPTHYKTIGTALTNLTGSDPIVILISPGTYAENISLSRNNVALVGADRNGVIIQGKITIDCTTSNLSTSTISTLTIQPTASSTPCIQTTGGPTYTITNVTIDNCTLVSTADNVLDLDEGTIWIRRSTLNTATSGTNKYVADTTGGGDAIIESCIFADYLTDLRSGSENISIIDSRSLATTFSMMGAENLDSDKVAIGSGAKATGDHSTAIGETAEAQANKAVAIGYGAVAEESGSVAIGEGANAQDQGSFALGNAAIAIANGSVAIGPLSNASGYDTLAVGRGTEAGVGGNWKTASVAIGAFAKTDTDLQIKLGGKHPGWDPNTTIEDNKYPYVTIPGYLHLQAVPDTDRYKPLNADPTPIPEIPEPSIYSILNGSEYELWVHDEDASDTRLNSHADPAQFSDNPYTSFVDSEVVLPWSFHHKNHFVGKEAIVDMAKAMKWVEEKMKAELGEEEGQITFVRDLPEENIRDYDNEIANRFEKRLAQLPWVEVPISGDHLPEESLRQVEVQSFPIEIISVPEVEWKTGAVYYKQVEKYGTTPIPTGEYRYELKENYKFENGKLYRRPNLNEIDFEALYQKAKAPDWISDRVAAHRAAEGQ